MREEEKRSSQDKSKNSFFKKRWVYPTVYIASAAIILTGVLWYQNSGTENIDQSEYKATDMPGKKINDQPAVEVNRAMENFVMPVVNEDDAVIQMGFYDNDGDAAEQEAALVFYDNTYHPNTGLDIASKDGKEFDVIASLSGTVTNVMEDAVLGNVIEIEHDKGIVTQYQSVKDYEVKVGDEVEQGQVIAKSGTSLINEKAGNHVHFEIRKDNVPVNPHEFFNKPLSALQDANVIEEKASSDADAGKSEDAVEEDVEGSSEEDAEGTTPAEDKPAEGGSDKKDEDKDAGEDKDKDSSTDSDTSTNS
ncbi:M23 family metallopeptidase [Mesobacillus selenatarsenatis]|uniref:Stage II sporulation protein related to metaloproteases (SpoIIQ) n=1 Tax=Mesobacillus selenatarsenatis (strain DSM 18680 / JCM 14380 / FERM P-15431 / SF-1) TaxID=1321606 RepID=A0A0A8WY65_MESS1|nr:M23 family metallopeptidase [Mesobacillus selenatarsenatis]GAM12660.1 stage II sporulation protein related to metaloproteases (SpoIIQ) [Mesobacillus selenatarsenatis SF-1]